MLDSVSFPLPAFVRPFGRPVGNAMLVGAKLCVATNDDHDDFRYVERNGDDDDDGGGNEKVQI